MDATQVKMMLDAVRDNQVERVKQFIKQSPGLVNGIHDYGTPLHYAAREDNVEMIKLLAANGVNLNIQMISWPKGSTPLHWAVQTGKTAAAETLVKLGANVNMTTAGGWTPLHIAVERDRANMVELLIANKANVNIAAKAYLPLTDPEELGAYKQHHSLDNATPLDWAEALNKPALAELLKKAGGRSGKK